ncbi:uncharacterized protein Z518_00110 [Rhinocladiella mackenziei CBS 650.93]|uniref:Inositol polyphosphate-related phosphatase domain-containing protein n=1 Tax=Rhinocladiella mackenziei CBS 650.93 TaxID=1442369 RepID=A0A0D2G3C5_9EURO|nr:uncharacterized protein Z518_00110 [Rhinocladiella mackenziei CBS 650.93]KIX09032.1 hypothetical protein Z518_00110 [Rhinocladiella mackenziei CBS 650.93]
MAQNMEEGTDAASIKPVSSLRSHFEGLKANQAPPDDRGSIPLSPQVLKPVDGPSPPPILRASFDLPRPKSPWEGGGNTRQGGPHTPVKGTESPPKPGHKRPMSMLLQSSPQLTPSVKVDSPRSPPRTFFERSSSRSPERVDNTPFAKVRELISQHSSRESTRPPTPGAPSGDRSATLKTVEDANGTGEAQEAKSPGRPPPVNRADKPKIPAKPSTMAIPVTSSALNTEVRRPSSEARVSPFSTPPSSVENSPSRSPESIAPLPAVRSVEPLPLTSNVIAQPHAVPPPDQTSARPKDARLWGFSHKTSAPERKDPRMLGFTAPEPRPPSRGSDLPTRANTVSEKPTRDPRELGFSSAKPSSPRHVSETIRHAPSPPPPPVQPPRTHPLRDARQHGFSGHQSPDIEMTEEEPHPKLPPRRNIEPPPRPSNESKNTTRSGPPPAHAGAPAPDRSKKPVPNQQASRAPTMPMDTRFPPPPKRASFDEGEPLPTTTPKAQTFGGDFPKRPAARAYANDSDEAEEAAEELSTAKSEYPDSTHTNRRPPFCKGGLWEIPTKSDSRIAKVCGQYLCTAGYVTRVFDMTSGEQIMSINHGETVKVTAVAFKPAAELTKEGTRLWLGTNTGDIMEVDVATHTILTTNSSHNRREIVRILRNRKDLWTLDDDGKLFVWKADETGVPNLKYSHVSLKVQRGHSFSMAIDGNLWLATGKEVRIYKPGNENSFSALTKPLSQHGNGDVTCGAYANEGGGRAYFGHIDGRVSIYSTKDFSTIGNIKASDYKINGLSFVGDKLWAAFKTGMVYIYDTSTTPWKVKKDWRAHNGPATGVLLDPSSVWTLQRLQVVTIGHDNCVRLWDAALEDDWIETEMQERDVEYCKFREVRAAVVTWNVGASNPYDLRGDFIADAIHPDDPPEILVFGFQEVVDLEDRAVTAKSILGFGKKKDTVKTEQHQSRVYREWRDYLSKIISRYTSARYAYSELQTSSLIGLFQCVFIRQEERPHVRNLQAASVKLGLKGHYGNKGALVTRFVLDDSSVCFINCHLAAGQTQTSHRNNDVASILEAEALDPEPDPDVRSSLYVGGGDGTQILDHEICVLNGDLNYRIDAIPRDTVVNMIKRNELAKLLERDQIMVSRRRVSGFRLSPFIELPITFAPTYKYDVGTDNYDTSEKKRSPAWCDRLLYRGPGRVKQIEYRRHEVRTSDHRPVSGVFKLRVKTIDARKRAKVKEDCFQRFSEVRKHMAERASVEYLVTTLGVGDQEAKRLIAAK